MMLRNNLEYFSKDEEGSWLSGIQNSAVSSIFSQLYEERYKRSSILHDIKEVIKKIVDEVF